MADTTVPTTPSTLSQEQIVIIGASAGAAGGVVLAIIVGMCVWYCRKSSQEEKILRSAHHSSRPHFNQYSNGVVQNTSSIIYESHPPTRGPTLPPRNYHHRDGIPSISGHSDDMPVRNVNDRPRYPPSEGGLYPRLPPVYGNSPADEHIIPNAPPLTPPDNAHAHAHAHRYDWEPIKRETEYLYYDGGFPPPIVWRAESMGWSEADAFRQNFYIPRPYTVQRY